MRGQVAVKAILGLYEDLPALGCPSVNAELLEQLVAPARDMTNLPDQFPSPLPLLCRCFELSAPSRDADRIQLEVLLAHFPILRHRADESMLLETEEDRLAT